MEFGQFVSHDIQFNALSQGKYIIHSRLIIVILHNNISTPRLLPSVSIKRNLTEMLEVLRLQD
jgi:hypothetical protein